MCWQREPFSFLPVNPIHGIRPHLRRRSVQPVRVCLEFHARVRRMAMHLRTRQALEELPPEARAAAEAAIARSAARRATPEGQAEQDEVIRKVREEFPPLA